MVSKSKFLGFERSHVVVLAERLGEKRRFIQVVSGPRQVGKTTLVQQALARVGRPHLFVSADEPALKDGAWLRSRWEQGRLLARGAKTGAVLVVDEIQKIGEWSETVKRLWDEDGATGLDLKVVLLGSSPLLMQQGLTESLAGRFEVIRVPHWSYSEMKDAFGFTLEQFICFGGYPGAASLVDDPERWRRYILDALVETTISRDVLLMTRVDKPALLRRLFELACAHSGQILSYTKMLGQLQDHGNVTTLAHYLELLSGSGLVCGIPKFTGNQPRVRGSSPKLQVMNMALMTSTLASNPLDVLNDDQVKGRWVESVVGTHLVRSVSQGDFEMFYWREGDSEVDFVVRRGKKLTAIEVKSGAFRGRHGGLESFLKLYPKARVLLVGQGGVDLEAFLSRPVEDWVS